MEPGTLIGDRFELAERIGRGGMGAVFRALDRHTGASVAVKMIGAADPGISARFARESRVLAELRHPGIVRYVAHGETPAGERFLAMDWLEGRDLAQRLKDGPVSTTDALEVARGVADAVGAAHDRGVIHRDLKPSNIFLVGDSPRHVKVLDFGIASSARSATVALTRTGVALGTPGFMAPEQARGRAQPDARADVYSLGCVMFTMLAGEPPFAASHMMASLVKSVLEQTPRISQVFADVPPEIDELVHRMMAKDPDKRPTDARAARTALDELGDIRHTSAPGRPAPRPTLTTDEQRLLCVLLISDFGADDRRRAGPDDATRDTLIAGREPVDVNGREIARLVKSFGGRFDALVGPAALATFEGDSAPTDQVGRAARCALAIREHLPQAAIVLTTGRGAATRGTSEGEVVNRAVGLLELTQKNLDLGPPILLDEASFALLEGRFEIFCTLLGHVLIGERDALHAERKLLGRNTPCVGRSREIGTLDAIFDDCIAESVASAAILTGPPGVGKSRIRQAFIQRRRERGEALEIWIARGDAMSAGSPFGLAASLVRAAAGISGGEPPDAIRARLARRIARRGASRGDASVVEILAEMLGVPFDDDASPRLAAARRDPLVMGDQMRRAFEEIVKQSCKTQPLLLVLEDLQWGDLSTVQFIDATLRNLSDAPLMVLATARPEIEEAFPNLWRERGAQEIRIGPLTKKASRQLVTHVVPEAADTDVGRIIERAGGHPLLLEEMVRALHEDPGGALPASALAMVESRVMALDHEARRVLRAASVFGRSFWQQGVSSLIAGERPDAVVQDWLQYLTEQEWIVQRDPPRLQDQLEYGFAQDVVREAVYAMLTDDDRRLGHRLAGGWLADAGERDDVVLARHFELGGEAARAAMHYERAANHALDGNDFEAAIRHAERAAALGPDEASLGRVRTVQAEAHLHLGAFEPAMERSEEALARLDVGSPDWCRAAGAKAQAAGKLGRAEALRSGAHQLLAVDVERSARVPFAAAGATATVQLLIAGDTELADRMAKVLDRLVAQASTSEAGMLGHVTRALSARAAFSGDPGETLALLRKAVRAFEKAGDVRSACASRKTQGWYAAECGALEEGERALVEAIALADRLGLPNLVAHAQFDLASPLIRLGKLVEAREVLQAALSVFIDQGDHRLEAGALGCLAWVDSLEGKSEAAVAKAKRAVDIAPSPPAQIAALAFLAHAEVIDAGLEDALTHADRGLALLKDGGAAEEGASMLALARAEALQGLGQPSQAKKAIAQARLDLLGRAKRISDPALRVSFLTRIYENRRIMDLAEQGRRG